MQISIRYLIQIGDENNGFFFLFFFYKSIFLEKKIKLFFLGKKLKTK